jgi:hypothetical protein
MVRRSAVVGICLVFLPARANAAAPAPVTVAAFARYVQLTEARLDAERQHGPFLWIDGLAEPRRSRELARVRGGEIVIERLETRAAGRPIGVGPAMVHHWAATVLIPGVTLERVVSVLQDYDRHARVFAPAVLRSQTRSRAGEAFVTFVRLNRKKVITVVLDTENEVRYSPVDAQRQEFRARTTSVREVDAVGTPQERILSEAEGRGYMWRLNTYGRLEARDGGVIVQFETVSLSRDIPFGLGWLIGPFVTSVPRESLVFTLDTLRRVVANR